MQSFYLSHGLLIPDALIAATALEYDWTLYTKNIRHFRGGYYEPDSLASSGGLSGKL